MTPEERDWLEAHLGSRLDRIEAKVGDLRERIAIVETKAVLGGVVAAMVVTPIVAAIIVRVMR